MNNSRKTDKRYASKSKWRQIQQPPGTVYGFCRVRKLYGGVYIGDAERNIYVDKHHEVNLYVHYNFRVPGEYKFIPEFRFYITNGRHSLSAVQEVSILEEYASLEEAASCPFFNHFCEMAEGIKKEIQKNPTMPENETECSSFRDFPGKGEVNLYIARCDETQEWVGFHHFMESGQWLVSAGKEHIMELWHYLDDFYELEPRELHILTWYPAEEATQKGGKYFAAFKKTEPFIQRIETPVNWVPPPEI